MQRINQLTEKTFRWLLTLRMGPAPQGATGLWKSAADFRGPLPEPMGVWAQFAQVLLLSNEFAFIE